MKTILMILTLFIIFNIQALSSEATNDKCCRDLVISIFKSSANKNLSTEKYVIENSENSYNVKWKEGAIKELLSVTKKTCNREEAKEKIVEDFLKYYEYKESFYDGTLTKKILQDQIIKTLNKNIIEKFGIKNVNISTQGDYPYLEEVSVQLLSACGFKIEFNIYDFSISLKNYKIKSKIKHKL